MYLIFGIYIYITLTFFFSGFSREDVFIFYKNNSLKEKVSMIFFQISKSILWFPAQLADYFTLPSKTHTSMDRSILNIRWSKNFIAFLFIILISIIITTIFIYLFPDLLLLKIIMIIIEFGLLTYGISHIIGSNSIIDKIKVSSGNPFVNYILFSSLYLYSFIIIILFNDYYFKESFELNKQTTFFSYFKNILDSSFSDILKLIISGEFDFYLYLKIIIGAVFAGVTVMNWSLIKTLSRNDIEKAHLAIDYNRIGKNEKAKKYFSTIKKERELKNYYEIKSAFVYHKNKDLSIELANKSLNREDENNLETKYAQLILNYMHFGNQKKTTSFMKDTLKLIGHKPLIKCIFILFKISSNDFEDKKNYFDKLKNYNNKIKKLIEAPVNKNPNFQDLVIEYYRFNRQLHLSNKLYSDFFNHKKLFSLNSILFFNFSKLKLPKNIEKDLVKLYSENVNFCLYLIDIISKLKLKPIEYKILSTIQRRTNQNIYVYDKKKLYKFIQESKYFDNTKSSLTETNKKLSKLLSLNY